MKLEIPDEMIRLGEEENGALLQAFGGRKKGDLTEFSGASEAAAYLACLADKRAFSDRQAAALMRVAEPEEVCRILPGQIMTVAEGPFRGTRRVNLGGKIGDESVRIMGQLLPGSLREVRWEDLKVLTEQ